MKLIRFLFICTFFASSGLGAQEKADAAGGPGAIPDLGTHHSIEEVQLLVVPLSLDQLQTEADEWQQYVQEAMAEIANLKVAALSAEGEKLDAIHVDRKSVV